MIYFVSDIHLGCADSEQSKRAERAFCRWLDMVAADAEAIYLLGDIFDFWFEYHKVAPKGFVRVLGRLAMLADRGVKIVFYPGNHDMWCLDYFASECGMRIEHKPSVEVVEGRKIHLAHGDNMNMKGQIMLRFMNFLFRSSVVRWAYRWLLHPDAAAWLGEALSGKSRKAQRKPKRSKRPRRSVDEIVAPLVEYADMHHAANGDVESYIFGHIHIPCRKECDGFEVLFLSDWSNAVATYATLENNCITLKTFNIDETIS